MKGVKSSVADAFAFDSLPLPRYPISKRPAKFLCRPRHPTVRISANKSAASPPGAWGYIARLRVVTLRRSSKCYTRKGNGTVDLKNLFKILYEKRETALSIL